MTADQEKLLRNIEETRVGLGLAPPKTASHPSPVALKPCEECGEAARQPVCNTDASGSFWEIVCVGLDCMVSQIGRTQAEAIAAWNRRAKAP